MIFYKRSDEKLTDSVAYPFTENTYIIKYQNSEIKLSIKKQIQEEFQAQILSLHC